VKEPTFEQEHILNRVASETAVVGPEGCGFVLHLAEEARSG